MADRHAYTNIDHFDKERSKAAAVPPPLAPRAYKGEGTGRTSSNSGSNDVLDAPDGEIVYADLDMSGSGPSANEDDGAYGPIDNGTEAGYGPVHTQNNDDSVVYSDILHPGGPPPGGDVSKTAPPPIPQQSSRSPRSTPTPPPNSSSVQNVTQGVRRMNMKPEKKPLLQVSASTTGDKRQPCILTVEVENKFVNLVHYDIKGKKVQIYPVHFLRAYGQKENRLRLDCGSRCPSGVGTVRFELKEGFEMANRLRAIRKEVEAGGTGQNAANIGKGRPAIQRQTGSPSYQNVDEAPPAPPKVGSDYRNVPAVGGPKIGSDYRDL